MHALTKHAFSSLGALGRFFRWMSNGAVSPLFILLENTIPVIGYFFFDWDTRLFFLYFCAETAVIILGGLLRAALLPIDTLWRRIRFIIFSDYKLFILAAIFGPIVLLEIGTRGKTLTEIVLFLGGNILLLGILSARDIIRWRRQYRQQTPGHNAVDLKRIRFVVETRIVLMLIVSGGISLVENEDVFDYTTLVIIFFVLKAYIEVGLSIGRRRAALTA